MKNILFVLLFFIVGCEKHKQAGWALGGETLQKFSLQTAEKMFAAVAQDDYFGLETLLEESNEGINEANKEGKFLLHEAIRTNRVLITSLLMKYGADPSLVEEESGDAFSLLEGKTDKEQWENILNLLPLDQKFLDLRSVKIISEAAEDTQGNVQKKLQIFFELGGDVNARNRRKFTLLAIAASKNLPSLTQFLCETDGVEINAKVGRYTILALVKRLSRRDPTLKRIMTILKEFGAR